MEIDCGSKTIEFHPEDIRDLRRLSCQLDYVSETEALESLVSEGQAVEDAYLKVAASKVYSRLQEQDRSSNE